MYHTPYELRNVVIGAYYRDTQTLCTPSVAKPLRFLDATHPDWDELWNVSNCLLCTLEVRNFVRILTHDRVDNSYWIPYIFLHEDRECDIRVSLA